MSAEMGMVERAMERAIDQLTTEIAKAHGCDRGTFTVCWGKVEKGLPCKCEEEARVALAADPNSGDHNAS